MTTVESTFLALAWHFRTVGNILEERSSIHFHRLGELDAFPWGVKLTEIGVPDSPEQFSAEALRAKKFVVCVVDLGTPKKVFAIYTLIQVQIFDLGNANVKGLTWYNMTVPQNLEQEMFITIAGLGTPKTVRQRTLSLTQA